MLPTLRHIPPRAITHIPGPPNIGSRRAAATLGVLHSDVAPYFGGVPNGQMCVDYTAATPSGTAPVWFAISDGGAGYIPWGSWQVAIYPVGVPLPPSGNLAFNFQTCQNTDVAAVIAGNVWAGFQTLRAQAISAGFKAAAGISVSVSFVGQSTPNPTGTLVVRAPFGVRLTAYYEGPFYYAGEGDPRSMIDLQQGYDNPLFLALWSPGNRAMLRAVESGVPSRYPGYPYPYPPYYGPLL